MIAVRVFASAAVLASTLLLPAAGARAAGAQSAAQPAATAAELPDYAQCLRELRPRAISAGIHPRVFDRHVPTAVPDPSVLELLNSQPEFNTPIWDYLAGLVDAERIADGKAMLQAHADTLQRVRRKYGVAPYTVVAVWGVESDYGNVFGSRPLLNSLTTLACKGRRQDFFTEELMHALRIVQSGDVAAADLVGSWAGAFGHTQFMPSTFQRIAVDFDGDGRRDLVGSVPDALASTAHYLDRAGWRTGQPWGYEVRLPDGFDTSVSGRTERRPLSYWRDRGIARVNGGAFDGVDGASRAALLLPAGPAGPAFLVFKNFDAIYAYNAAVSYALAIALLSDRLRGEPPLQTPWPTDDPGLSRRERRELQELLLARGHDIGEVDGIIGSRTRAAIKLEQQRLGMEADGRASQSVLQALRAP